MQKSHLFRMVPNGDARVLHDAIERGYCSVGWGGVFSIAGLSYPAFKEKIESYYGLHGRAASSALSAVWHIANDVHIGDYIVSTEGDTVHFGKVIREYYYCTGVGEPDWMETEDTAHRVGVSWYKKTVSRSALSDDFRSSLRSMRTYSDLSIYTDEITSIVEPKAHAKVVGVALDVSILLNDQTTICVSGLPLNLDEANQDALFDAIRDVYRR